MSGLVAQHIWSLDHIFWSDISESATIVASPTKPDVVYIPSQTIDFAVSGGVVQDGEWALLGELPTMQYWTMFKSTGFTSSVVRCGEEIRGETAESIAVYMQPDEQTDLLVMLCRHVRRTPGGDLIKTVDEQQAADWRVEHLAQVGNDDAEAKDVDRCIRIVDASNGHALGHPFPIPYLLKDDGKVLIGPDPQAVLVATESMIIGVDISNAGKGYPTWGDAKKSSSILVEFEMFEEMNETVTVDAYDLRTDQFVLHTSDNVWLGYCPREWLSKSAIAKSVRQTITCRPLLKRKQDLIMLPGGGFDMQMMEASPDIFKVVCLPTPPSSSKPRTIVPSLLFATRAPIVRLYCAEMSSAVQDASVCNIEHLAGSSLISTKNALPFKRGCSLPDVQAQFLSFESLLHALYPFKDDEDDDDEEDDERPDAKKKAERMQKKKKLHDEETLKAHPLKDLWVSCNGTVGLRFGESHVVMCRDLARRNMQLMFEMTAMLRTRNCLLPLEWYRQVLHKSMDFTLVYLLSPEERTQLQLRVHKMFHDIAVQRALGRLPSSIALPKTSKRMHRNLWKMIKQV